MRTAMAPLRGVSSGGCLAIATEDGTVAAFDVRDGGWMERKFTVQPPGSPRVTSLCAFAPVPLVPAVRPGGGRGWRRAAARADVVPRPLWLDVRRV